MSVHSAVTSLLPRLFSRGHTMCSFSGSSGAVLCTYISTLLWKCLSHPAIWLHKEVSSPFTALSF